MVVQAKSTPTRPPRPSPVSKIDKIASLKSYPDKDHALDLLHQVARAVAPIIHEFGFRVGTLCEMYPKNPSLLGLNVNRGQKILLRLRQPHNSRSYYPMSDLIGTFLHELTHNVHGPHDAKFYALLDRLRTRYETGGFLASDYVCEENKLGLGFRAPWTTPQSVREQRLQKLSKGMFKAEARRLGGSLAPTTPAERRQAMLDAVERRLRDSRWCPLDAADVNVDSSELEVKKLGEFRNGEYQEIIDLTRDDDDDAIEVVQVDACEAHGDLLRQKDQAASGGSDGDQLPTQYILSSSPGRHFIGGELFYPRRKMVANLNFEQIIESTAADLLRESRSKPGDIQIHSIQKTTSGSTTVTIEEFTQISSPAKCSAREVEGKIGKRASKVPGKKGKSLGVRGTKTAHKSKSPSRKSKSKKSRKAKLSPEPGRKKVRPISFNELFSAT